MEKSNSHKRRFRHSKKIVKKKNFVIMIKVMMIVLSLLLVVSCIMGTEPNNTGTNGNGGSNSIGHLNFSCDSNGRISATVNGKSINTGVSSVLGTDVKVGDVIHFTAEPDPEHSHYTVDWSGISKDTVSKKRKSATLKVESVSQDISVSVSFREKTNQEIVDDMQIENESFYSVQDTSSDGDIEKLFENGKTASAWLGLARKEGDDKLYLIAKDIEGTKPVNTRNFIADFSVLKEICKEITENYEGNVSIIYPLESPTGNEDLCFESVKQVLEWRWQNTKKDFPGSSTPFFFYSGSEPWLTLEVRDFSDHQGLKMVCINETDLFHTVKADKADPEIYFFNDGSNPRIIDWVLTFVKDNDIYSFKVGKYSVSAANNPEVDATYDGIYACSLLMLKLSSLVRFSLEKQLMDNGISEDVAKDKAKSFLKDFEPFKNDFADLKSWDVYLTVGEMLEGIYTDGMNPLGAFRNTFKLTGDDAKEFWKQ